MDFEGKVNRGIEAPRPGMSGRIKESNLAGVYVGEGTTKTGQAVWIWMSGQKVKAVDDR